MTEFFETTVFPAQKLQPKRDISSAEIKHCLKTNRQKTTEEFQGMILIHSLPGERERPKSYY